MRIFDQLRGGVTALVAIILSISATAIAASAQGYMPWQWRLGHSSPGDTNRQVLDFPARVAPGQIIVSFTDRRLYYVPRRGIAIAYPIATPRQQDHWHGELHITHKRTNPPAAPIPAARQEAPLPPCHVVGDRSPNPLGSHALYLGATPYLIHGTDTPSTMDHATSNGCVRMHNADVNDLYRRVTIGTKVTVTRRSFSESS